MKINPIEKALELLENIRGQAIARKWFAVLFRITPEKVLCHLYRNICLNHEYRISCGQVTAVEQALWEKAQKHIDQCPECYLWEVTRQISRPMIIRRR